MSFKISTTLFEWTKTVLVANKTKGIKITMRVKSIFLEYVMVAATYIKHARKTILKMFSTYVIYCELKV